MTRTKAQARRMIEVLKPAVAWARAHAVLIVSVVLCASAALWLHEHDARLKREFELGQLRRETTKEVSALRARAASAMEEFRANAQVIRNLEARRAPLEREAAALRQKLSSLREEERRRVQTAGTPGHVEMSGKVTSRLDPAEFGSREPGLEGETGNSKLETGNSKLETAKSSVVSPQLSVATDTGPRTTDYGLSPTPDSPFPTPGTQLASPESRTPNPALDACREQSSVQDQLIANCEERVTAGQAVIDAMHRSVADLQENIRAQDEIAVRLDAQHRAELKAARGSRLGRFGRVMQYVGVGVVIGVVIAH